MSDRKYRQRGYMDSDREPQRPTPQSKPQARPRQAAHNHEAPRSPRMMAFGEIVKCASCGAKAPSVVSLETTCSKCKAELHTCRQCTYFDPGARFECSKPITKKIVNKNARNSCELFAPRTVVERETSSSPSSSSSSSSSSGGTTDARQAFANLFKK